MSEPSAGVNEPDVNESDVNGPMSKDKTDSGSMAERISFLLALVIVLAVLGGVAYLWVRDRNQDPPVLQVSTSATEQREAYYYVPFTVKNAGGETAASVQIMAELRVSGEIVEWGEQTVDFISFQEEASGAFIFTRDPSAGELMVRVASYSRP